MAPFPHPAHRTGQADFPHPALGQDFTLSRATPSAASEQFSELIGCPISASFTTYCVCLELRSLPSTGVACRTSNPSARYNRWRTAISLVPSVTALIPSIMDRTLLFYFPAPLVVDTSSPVR